MNNKRDIDVSKEAGYIWKIANDVLRDIFKRTEYPDIIYPMVLIRRLECLLEAQTEKIKKEEAIQKLIKQMGEAAKPIIDRMIKDKLEATIGFTNDSGFTLQILKNEGETNIKNNFPNYLNGYQSKIKKKVQEEKIVVEGKKKVKKKVIVEKDKIQEVIRSSGIKKQIDKLVKNKILYSLVEEFCDEKIDLSPKTVSNIKMGYIFEELIRRFSEQNNSEAGEHYTPREVIDLMISLLDIGGRQLKESEMLDIYDPACGTGGMLSACKEYIEDHVQKTATIKLHGQEVNDKTWAICEADLMIKGEDAKIIHGDTLFNDGFPNTTFDYMLSNPPYGKSWSKIKTKTMENSNGRFEIGQPRTSDGQLLFTLHMVSKMKPVEKGGSAAAIVHNGSPLFSGDAGSGESKIRQHLIENDLLETIVALPTQLFYNTGIATYIWIIRNNKPPKRQGKIQLINAVDFWKPMKRSLGNKRRQIVAEDVERIVQLHSNFAPSEHSKIFDLDDFAYRKVSLRLKETDENGNYLTETKRLSLSFKKLQQIAELTKEDKKELKSLKSEKKAFTFLLKEEFIKEHYLYHNFISVWKTIKGKKITLSGEVEVHVLSRDTEIIPWKADRTEWLNQYVEKDWIFVEEKKGYEVPFTKLFYKYQPLRPLETVLKEFKALEYGDENQIGNQTLLKELGLL